jgi:branched-chain amino acid transport system ATP-binding protein
MPLVTRSASVRFGGVVAIDDVSISLACGEILGLIGPNGAGKTTLVNVLSGFQRPSDGEVWLDERDVTGERPDAFARAGVARTFQAVRLFKGLTVAENLEVGLVAHGAARTAARRRAREMLDTFSLGDRADVAAGALSYGEERRVGLARALALSPRYLLLDEPAAGMAPAEAEELGRAIAAIRDQHGCGILMIEHNMALVLSLCDRVHVLGSGRTIAMGPPTAIQSNAAVRAAYLGGSGSGAR